MDGLCHLSHLLGEPTIDSGVSQMLNHILQSIFCHPAEVTQPTARKSIMNEPMYLPIKMVVFHCHVSFQGANHYYFNKGFSSINLHYPLVCFCSVSALNAFLPKGWLTCFHHHGQLLQGSAVSTDSQNDPRGYVCFAKLHVG